MNQDFGNQDEVEEEYLMVLPDSSLYKDFNSETDCVDLKIETIEVYLKPMEKTMDSDAKHLYKECFF
jgi:PHP family Zn ribbon phosphoesterase